MGEGSKRYHPMIPLAYDHVLRRLMPQTDYAQFELLTCKLGEISTPGLLPVLTADSLWCLSTHCVYVYVYQRPGRASRVECLTSHGKCNNFTCVIEFHSQKIRRCVRVHSHYTRTMRAYSSVYVHVHESTTAHPVTDQQATAARTITGWGWHCQTVAELIT